MVDWENKLRIWRLDGRTDFKEIILIRRAGDSSRKCIGCEACVEAGSEVNLEKYPDPQKPFPKMYPNRVPVEDWSGKKDVNDRLTPYNWLFIQHAEVERKGKAAFETRRRYNGPGQ